MNNQEYFPLFAKMYPNHFESEAVLGLPEDSVFEEMILPLDNFDADGYNKNLSNDISFGFYNGSIAKLRKAVEKVDPDWANFFSADSKIFCGYVNGRVASFCLIDDMGVYKIGNREIKVGGPGCVGTLPEYRSKGIGLTMVCKATQILKGNGFDCSYIHFTAVPAWYGKLGYRTLIKWTRGGII